MTPSNITDKLFYLSSVFAYYDMYKLSKILDIIASNPDKKESEILDQIKEVIDNDRDDSRGILL